MENKGTYSTDSTTPDPDRSELRRLLLDCQRLLSVVASRPGAIKLLLGVQQQLELFAGYKANRQKPTSRTSNQTDVTLGR